MSTLPKQVQDQLDNWDEFFQLAGGALEASQPAAPTGAQEPTSQPKPIDPPAEPPSQPASPQTQQGNVHDFWQQKYHQDMGAMRAQFQQTQQALADLQAQVAQRNEEPEGIPEPEFRFEGPVNSLSEEEVEAIGGAGTVSAVVKIIKEVSAKMIAEHITALRSEMQDTRSTIANVTKQSHDASIIQAHKDAPKLFTNEYLSRWLQTQRMPYSNQTKLERFQEAHENLETQVVIDMLTEFKQFVKQVKEKREKELGQQQQFTPSATPQAQNSNNNQPQFKASDMQRAQEQYIKGQITDAQFQEIEKKFNAALASGNMVFDA